jgi:hypothetical protein
MVGLASVNVLCAATYYVSKTGSDSNNGSSGSPWLTPGKSIAKLSAGDTLVIQSGTYQDSNAGGGYVLTNSGTATNPITILGQGAIIDIQVANGQLYTFSGSNVIMDGLKFTSTLAGGIANGGILGIAGNHCIFKNCELYGIAATLSGTGGDELFCFSYGGGSSFNVCSNLFIHDIRDGDIFRLFGYTNTITSCTISNCTNPNYNYGGASKLHADTIQIFGDNNVPSVNNIFECNYVLDCGLSVAMMSQDSRSNIHDNTFRNNVYVNLVTTMFNGANRTHIYNNLFINVGCVTASGVAMYAPNAAWDPAGSDIMNNAFIVYGIGFSGTSASGFLIDNNYFGTMSYVAPGTVGTHAVNGGNPQFVNGSTNAGVSDFHISLSTSVLVGAGTNLSYAFTTDKDGHARPASGAWDIGPYQFSVSSPDTSAAIQVSPSLLTFGAVAAGASATNTFTVQNVGSGTLSGTATVTTAYTNFLTILSGGNYTGSNSLGAGQSQVVAVRYTPTRALTDSGSITCSGGVGAQMSVMGSLSVLSGLLFQSSSGVITAPFVTNSGGYVSQSIQTSVNSGGSAVYAFVITNAGNYTVSANVNAPGDGANSFYVNIDAQPTDPTMIWDIPVTSGFTNQTVSWRGNGTDTTAQYAPEVFNLTAGVHQLIIVGREAGAQLGQITIAPYSDSRPSPPAPPGNLQIVPSP